MKKQTAWLLFIGFIVVICTLIFIADELWSPADILQPAEKEVEVTADTAVILQPAEKAVEVRFMEIPELSHIENTIIITHYLPEQEKSNIRNYSILYDTIQKVAYWVAYPLHDIYLGNSGRSEAWNYDPLIARHLQPRASRGLQGFDRGHQLPSADRTYSRAGNVTTYYFTNMTAQNASLNRGVWETLESRVRTWVARCDTLYVVTGAMITTACDNEIQYSLDNDGRDMAIPKYYYKAIAQKRGENYYTAAYKIENIAPVNRNIDAYRMTVTELEEKTGFVFFPALPKNAKDTVIVEYWR